MTGSYVVYEGTGPALVLIHGVGLDHTMWDRLVSKIRGHFFIIRYDVLGHGKTPAFNGQLTFQQLTRQLADILDESGVDTICLVGFSLGALIAQAFTLEFPERVGKLVLLNSAHARNAEQKAGITARLKQVEDPDSGLNVEASITRWFTEQFREDNPGQIRRVEERIRNNDREGFLAAYRLFVQSDSLFAGKLHDIRVPSLIITGEGDVGSTPGMSRAIAAEIEGSELMIFPNVKHMLPVENADKLGGQLIRFVNED